MNYRSYYDLNNALKAWGPRICRDIDLVAGVPRSGLITATLLAMYMNLPVTDVKGLLEGRIIEAGSRLRNGSQRPRLEGMRVLVVDDSVKSGSQMRRVREAIAAARLPCPVRFVAVYITPEGHRWVDDWFEVVERPRVFEWNLFSHSTLNDACVDIDGVLCRDPSRGENDDGPGYLRFIEEVEPVVRPSKRIGWLVTCRLEKYRRPTEEWLRRNGIEFEHLVMMNWPDARIRREMGGHAKFKADVYNRTGSRFFIESCPKQARGIAVRAGKPVLCTTTGEMVEPVAPLIVYKQGGRSLRRLAIRFANDPAETIAALKRAWRKQRERIKGRMLLRIRKHGN